MRKIIVGILLLAGIGLGIFSIQYYQIRTDADENLDRLYNEAITVEADSSLSEEEKMTELDMINSYMSADMDSADEAKNMFYIFLGGGVLLIIGSGVVFFIGKKKK